MACWIALYSHNCPVWFSSQRVMDDSGWLFQITTFVVAVFTFSIFAAVAAHCKAAIACINASHNIVFFGLCVKWSRCLLLWSRHSAPERAIRMARREEFLRGFPRSLRLRLLKLCCNRNCIPHKQVLHWIDLQRHYGHVLTAFNSGRNSGKSHAWLFLQGYIAPFPFVMLHISIRSPTPLPSTSPLKTGEPSNPAMWLADFLYISPHG